jgi:transcriptional regulator with XRE-family HTH domain
MTNIVEEVVKNLTGLRDARKSAGLSQRALADLVGTDPANVSGMESAARSMSIKMGRRLSEHVDIGSAELVIANRLAAMKRAKKERDPAAVILAAKGILEIAGDRDLTPEGEAFLEAVADEALEFAGTGLVSKSASTDEEVYGYDPERNALGHNVGVTKAAASREEGAWPSLPGSGAVLTDPEEYDEPGHDGRNIHGHRIAPLPDRDEDGFEDGFEEEEE